MPGRYSLTAEKESLENRFHAEMIEEERGYRPRYNISPTQKIPVILNSSPEKIIFARWGFHRPWSKQEIVNARSEEIEKNRVFGKSFSERRCLIPADSYYEWEHRGKDRLPYRIIVKADDWADDGRKVDSRNDGNNQNNQSKSSRKKSSSKERNSKDRSSGKENGKEIDGIGRIFSIAGVFEESKNDETGEVEISVATITAEPNSMVKTIHQRMPAILDEKDEKAWLESKDLDLLKNLLRTYPEEKMMMYRISTDINSSRKDDQSVIRHVDEEQTRQTRLTG